MAIETRKPEEEIHGERIPRPRFGPGSDGTAPAGNPTDPRGNDVASGRASDPRGDKLYKPEALSDAEKEASKGPGLSKNDETLGSGHRTGDRLPGLRGRFSDSFSRGWGVIKRNPKKSAGAGITGLLVGGGIFGISIIQGPLQIIHLSQILQQSFSAGDNSTLKRTKNLYRYYRTGDVGSTRVGALGNSVFDRTIKQLNSIGIEFDRTGSIGNQKAMTIDTSKHPDFKGMSREEASKAIARKLGLPDNAVSRIGSGSNVNGDKFGINMRDFDIDKLRSITGGAVDDLGNNAVYGALQKRVLKVFYNIGFHPLNKPLNKLAIKADRRARIKAEEERKEKTRGNLKAKYDEQRGKLKDKVGGKVGFGVGAAITGTGAVCIAKELSEIVPAYNKVVREISAADAMDLISMGAQVQSGDDFDINQLGNTVEAFEDDKGKDIWQGKALQASIGKKDPKGQEIGAGLRSAYDGEGTWEKINNVTSGLPLVNFTCSTAGEVFAALVGVGLTIAGPGGWAIKAGQLTASTAVSLIVLNIVKDAIQPEDVIPKTISGPEGGNFVAYGAREAANMTERARGGTELSNTESASIDQGVQDRSKEEFKSKNFFARAFDLYDHRSLASTTLNNVNLNLASNLQNTILGFLNINRMSTGLVSVFMPKLQAAESQYDWGFNRYGMSSGILDGSRYEDPYENAEKVAQILDDNPDDIIDRAKKCFGVELQDGQDGWEAAPSEGIDQYGKDYPGANCNDSDEDWLRVRLFIFDDSILSSAACYKGDENACSAIGATASEQGSQSEGSETAGVKIDLKKIRESSVNIKCAKNTKDVGVHDGYTEGKKVRIRVCAVSNINSSSEESNNGYGVTGANGKLVVNSRVSGAVYSMVEAAKKDGVNLDASSGFRTMAHQTDLCPCDGINVARPGFSNHQLGVAIDFGGNGTLINSSSQMWKWLNNNADRFSYKPYSVEPWHWSPLEND